MVKSSTVNFALLVNSNCQLRKVVKIKLAAKHIHY